MFGVGGNVFVKNLTLTTKNTLYEYKLPDWTRAMSIQARPSVDVLVYSKNDAMSDYFTIKTTGTYWEPNIVFSGSLWFSCGTDGIVLEIITWNTKAG